MRSMTAFLLLSCFFSTSTFSQTSSATSLSIKNHIGNASPYWFHTNQDGIVEDSGFGTYIFLSRNYSKTFKNGFSFNYEIEPTLRFSSNSSLFFPLISSGITFKKLNVQIGRFDYKELHTLDDLRTGSFVQSRNAIPIPKIELRTDFIYVPLTREFVKVKGTFTHGWFEKNRTVKNPLLHQKTFYLFVGRENKFHIYGGLVHSVIWGGYSNIESVGDIPQGFDDFIRSVFLGRGGDDAPLNDQNYYQGNQLGIYDLGISFRTKKWDVELYKQFLFEDYDGVVLRNFQDGIVGITSEELSHSNSGSFIKAFTYEFIYTKYQNGPTAPEDPDKTTPGSGRDDYYSHVIYRNGWTSFGRVIGNPLITVKDDRTIDQYLIDNNRVVAHHIGIKGNISEEINYKFKATFSNNHGRYQEEQTAENNFQNYKYEPSLKQLSLYLEFSKRSIKWSYIEYNFALASDIGQLYKNSFAIQIGITKRL